MPRTTIEILQGIDDALGAPLITKVPRFEQEILESIESKITAALGGGGAQTYEGGGNFSGVGDPNGVVTADKGAVYTELDGSNNFVALWNKTTDASNTGWV